MRGYLIADLGRLKRNFGKRALRSRGGHSMHAPQPRANRVNLNYLFLLGLLTHKEPTPTIAACILQKTKTSRAQAFMADGMRFRERIVGCSSTAVRRGTAFFLMSFVGALCCVSAHAARPAEPSDIKVLRALLEQPEDKIDLARAKLTIDKMVDLATDIEGTIAKLDAMAAANRRILPANATEMQKMLTLREYIYKAGPWNNNWPWRYDFSYQQGSNSKDLLLSHYIDYHEGQCFTMPLLYLLIAQRIGMQVALAESPNHAFVMWKDDKGSWVNLETTSGANPVPLAFFMQQRGAPMSQRSVDKGAYMRPLSKRETVAAMLEILTVKDMAERRYEHAAAITDLEARYNPKDIGAYLTRANAYHRMIARDITSKYRRIQDVPQSLIPRFERLADVASASEKAAFGLGYQMPESTGYMPMR